MSIERKDAANNNGYPSTVYGNVAASDVTSKGSAVGTGHGQVNTFKADYEFDFANLPSSFTSETDKGLTTIPAGAVLKAADIQISEALSGGTAFTLGISQPDGTVTDADGVLASNASTAVNTYVAGAGALLGAALANDGQLTVGGDRTAGKIKVSLTYLVL
jgi:hypothetical protein